MNLSSKLSKHFVAMGAVAAAFVGAQANAAIVHSGIVNLPIASTTNGLYLNVVTGATNEPGNTGGSTVAGWDVNPWSGSGLNFFSPSSPAGGAYVQRTGGGATANLPLGTLIDATSIFGSGNGSTTGAQPLLLNSSDNIVGFRFLNESTSTVNFGWMRISISTSLSAQPRALVEYAYEDSGAGITAGAVPAPASAALLGLGGLVAARRRRN